jgi:2-dehydro-3-deoxyglucarate aldolase/4-hydroxy-2-oxoheptanedioate aldolase
MLLSGYSLPDHMMSPPGRKFIYFDKLSLPFIFAEPAPILPRTALPKPLMAFWLETDMHKACEIGRLAGYDGVIFDMEHGTIEEMALDRLVPFCNSLGLASFVRVREANQARIQIALDCGARGVILPQIRDLEHARLAAAFAKYPPRGTRGMGYSRIHSYGPADDAWVKAQNERTICYVMIETHGAIQSCNAIAELDCVDGLFIGPSDLSLNRGRGMFACRDDDIADMDLIAKSASAHGKLWAAAAGHPQYRAAALAREPHLLAVADDLSALKSGFESLLTG